ncbi:sigma factor-like helix-turn-helix DNA-binding protein [Pontiella sulfatireligans]|uniref:RNA polymerase sigma-70 region 4 domain-containing protein n=1 Tax=Pontiella sulfatireligans TaxID=2750658 RepID=A0A6C2UKS5_9BACT|nr:sigma factor-like helix-turn-helix DNA-binding protein [Pontiella sulfatireligans]VGO20001.1 hypothetical protein SCARR_02061 [Pontiella sulfatireligans]
MTHDYDGAWREKFLTPEQWEREAFRLWQQQSAEAQDAVYGRLQTEHEMGVVAVDFLLVLSRRQQQVVQLYCLEGRTQVEVATTLGISQQTVSQHLMGKLRGGRQVGGAFRKLRKAIHKAAKARAGQSNRRARILSVFDELLDSALTRRRARELIGALMREARTGTRQEK